MNRLARALLTLSALILIAAGAIHTAAFRKAADALDASALPPFYTGAMKALWLIDSASLITLGVIFTLIAFRPALASRWIIALLAVLPAVTACFQYAFLGNFLPAHLLLASAVAAALAAVRIRGTPVPQSV